MQIHAAHGYSINQFLSPHHNLRTDQWGGSPEKRRRFVLAVYAEVRRQVGSEFTIAIKINSADFQRGGFSEEESIATIVALADAGIDLIEISGGTYEAPAMSGGLEKAVFQNVILTTGDTPATGAKPRLISTLETVPIASRDRRVVFTTVDELLEAPNWTPDGLSLIYNSTGRLFRLPVAGGTPVAIETATGTPISMSTRNPPTRSSISQPPAVSKAPGRSSTE